MDKKVLNINGTTFTIHRGESVFGDGSHESTASVLETMSKYDFKNKKVLDIGTGTGILSVFAALNGAEVTAVDVYPAAIGYAMKNFEENGVVVDLKFNDLTQGIDKKFDIIVANLAPAQQVENLKTVANRLEKDGVLIISWLNHLDLNRHARKFEVKHHIKNTEYDVYALQTKEET
jgi:ribosomal protein L11 methyltransferase